MIDGKLRESGGGAGEEIGRGGREAAEDVFGQTRELREGRTRERSRRGQVAEMVR